MLAKGELEEAVADLPLVAVHGPWTRVIGHHLLQGPPPGSPPDSPSQPLWAGGAPMGGARFTPKGSFGTVYLATDPVTALMEVAGAFVNPHAPMGTLRTPPWTLFAVDGLLGRMLDLTDPGIIDALDTSVDELSGSWRFSQELHQKGEGPLPPTQRLGAAARSVGTITGLQYHSAKNPGRGLGFAVFPDRMAPESADFLEVYDPHGSIEQRLP